MIQTAKDKNIVSEWLSWHFYQMPELLLQIWKSYLTFCADFFSVPLLLSTLLAPWRHESWHRHRGFNIGEFFGSLVYNLFSRIMGAVLRLVLIIIGIGCQALVFVFGLVIIVIWYAFPLIVILLLILFFYV